MGLLVWLVSAALIVSVFVNLALLHRHSACDDPSFGAAKGSSLGRSLGVDLKEKAEGKRRTDNQIDGVAVALLLHAPKWFQRRYTFTVGNILQNLPPNWKVQIFYTPHGASQIGIDLNIGLQRMVASGKVVLTEIAEEVIAKRKKRIELMTSTWVWNNMLSDRVFVFGGNGVVCSNSFTNFTSLMGYGYLGAPWSQFHGRGGDGGMSFRSRKLMIAAIEYEERKAHNDSSAYKKWGQEDHFFVKALLEMEKRGALAELEAQGVPVRIANREETRAYGAIGSIARETALVASGTLPGLSDKERDAFIHICPELRIVYPVLHNPNCFGAVVHKEECAASICALTKEKGGC